MLDFINNVFNLTKIEIESDKLIPQFFFKSYTLNCINNEIGKYQISISTHKNKAVVFETTLCSLLDRDPDQNRV